MAETDAQIDILFREGLHDMEVLPPSGTWDEISVSIGKEPNMRALFRIAASVAAIIAMALVTYQVGVRTSSELVIPLSALTSEQPASVSPFAVSQNQEAVSNTVNPTGVNDARPIETSGSDVNLSGVPDQSIKLAIYQSTNQVEVTAYEISAILRRNSFNTGEIATLKPEQFEYSKINPLLMPANETVVGNKWKVGASMSPTYLSSNLSSANKSLSDLRSDESAVVSYSGGLSVTYKMSGRLSVQTGVYYSSLGREISGITSYSGFTTFAGTKSGTVFGIRTSTGTISSTNRDIFLIDASSTRISGQYTPDNFDPVKADLLPVGSKLRQNFEYIEIPLMFSYKLIDRKIDFNILGGMSYNYLVNNRTYAMGDGIRILIGSTNEIKNHLLSSALAMSMEYNLTSKISLNLQPSFRYFLNSGDQLSLENPYSLGLYSGFTYKF